jgi:biopolymer transport protein ExbD
MSRRSFDTGESEEETIVDISPLIDCVFILLIFFIVTTTFVEEPGVEVDKAVSLNSEYLDKNCVLIALTEDGRVIHGGKEIGLAGLRPVVKRYVSREQLPVIIQADRNADSALFIRVMDEIKLAGAQRVFQSTR